MKRVYPAIFLVSCSSLMFEISLTRIFSISLWYHYAFMVISIAMLGIGFAGTALAVFPRRLDTALAVSPVLAGISMLLCYIVSHYISFDPVKFSWDKTQILSLALYCIVLSVPFFFSGMLIASAFSHYSERSGAIYCSDLTGAATGSLAVLLLLNTAAPEYAVFAASLLCLTGAIIMGGRKAKAASLLFIMINLFMIGVHPDFIKVRMSPYKSLPLYLTFPGAEHLKTYYSSYSQIDLFKSPAVRFAPGLSLLYSDPLPDQVGLAADGDKIDVITDARDKARLKFLEFIPAAAAYETGKKNNVLVIDPGGGLHALMAEYYGSDRIDKVEGNPKIVDVVRGHYDEFSGKLFESDTWTGYGRSFLQSHTGERYDLIDLSMTGTSVSGIFGISENYRLTVEAFRQYLSALSGDGIMSISLYLIPPPRTEFRILSTLVTALERLGVKDFTSKFLAIRSWDSLTILVKRSPFTDREIERIKDFSSGKRFDLLYYPGINKEELTGYIRTASDEYFNGFQNILDPLKRLAFIKGYLFDIQPVHDDNPFFHYYLRFGNMKAIYETMGHKWAFFLEEGYLLPVIFITVLIASSVIIVIPVLFRHTLYRRPVQFRTYRPFKPVILYFSMIGLGFMFVEVTLIQKGILLLENPSYSLAAVVTAILMGSGIGSATASGSQKIGPPFSLLILSFLIAVYSVIYPLFSTLLLSLNLPFRSAILVIALLPLGFFMGMPFPAGMKLLGKRHQHLIPWAWAINACLSVLSPVLTIMIALVWGFRSVLWLGALAYLIAFVSLKRMSFPASEL
jgi:spermidine synthase